MSVHFFHGDKGGVGKSFIAQSFVDWLHTRNITPLVVDSDLRNPDLARMFPDVAVAVNLRQRQLLAQIVGELAIAQNPDPQSATRRLNAALSPREAQNVVRIEQAKDAATLQHFQQLAAESGASMPARNNVMFHGVPPSSSTVMSVRASASFGNDAGSILLRTAASALLMPRFNVFSSGSQMLPPLLPRH